MLKGNFKNCYGLADFQMLDIPFDASASGKNRAVIYAPNGIMKSSLAKVLDDISKKKKTTDRIFTENNSKYLVNYYGDEYDERAKKAADNIYVIQSFDEKFESSSDSVSTILADETIRKNYEAIIKSHQNEISKINTELSALSGIAVKDIQSHLQLDFGLNEQSDWFDIIDTVATQSSMHEYVSELNEVRYSIVFNPQTQRVFETQDFVNDAKSFVDILSSQIAESKVLSSQFNDYNIMEFGKSLEKNNLFSANHKIIMSDGTEIKDYATWKQVVDSEFERIYSTPQIKTLFSSIGKQFNANEAVRLLKELIMNNKLLITHLISLSILRKNLWINYFVDSGIDLSKLQTEFALHKNEIANLNKQAEEQQHYWIKVVDEFKYRFKAPFDVSIQNGVNVVFKGEPARLVFTYIRGEERKEKSKDELMSFLSVGEKRALYLLQILFDLEKIKSKIKSSGKKQLIVADDVADSFDYTNKYAIIEYLKELTDNPFVDLLVLTHNFDFYRTVSSRLSIGYDACFVVQKNSNQKIDMSEFAYKNDYFKKGLLSRIQDGKISDNIEKQKVLISAIPFSRNICEYINEDNKVDFFTSLVHIKDSTLNILIDDLWDNMRELFKVTELKADSIAKRPVIDVIFETADYICANERKDVNLEDKIVLSIALRLKAELFLKNILSSNEISLECSRNQTREWINRATTHLNVEQMVLLEKINLITPESIHVNAFMYEPLIDVPNWQLIELYQQDYSAL